MSYDNVMEYKLVPTETFPILRDCSGCGGMQVHICKKNFRINANGNRLDVWLIYGCAKCGHTYNLPIYERIDKSRLPAAEYRKFLENDAAAVFRYGTDKTILRKSRVRIAWEQADYELVRQAENRGDMTAEETKTFIRLQNPYGFPVREDKIASDILSVSRGKAKELLKKELLVVSIVKEDTFKGRDT